MVRARDGIECLLMAAATCVQQMLAVQQFSMLTTCIISVPRATACKPGAAAACIAVIAGCREAIHVRSNLQCDIPPWVVRLPVTRMSKITANQAGNVDSRHGPSATLRL